MDKSAKFWNRIAEGYWKKPIADQATYEKKLEYTRQYLHQDMNVLEFGCGTGSTALIHAPYIKQIHGIDISQKMIDIARQQAKDQHITNASFECANLDNFSATGASFDMVLGMSILHLLPDRDEGIEKVYQWLKPGGLFVSSTFVKSRSFSSNLPIYLFQSIMPITAILGVLPTVKFFSEDDLKHSLTQAGFSLELDWSPGKGKALFVIARKPF